MIDLHVRLNKILNRIFVDMSVPSNSSLNNYIIYFNRNFKAFKSLYLSEVYYKFYNSYDIYYSDYTNNREVFDSSNIIPVMIVAYPELYKTGNVLFRNNIISIREIISGEDNAIPKINIFIHLSINNINGQFFGKGEFSINADVNSQFDIYGFYSKDVLNLVSLIFAADRPFHQTNVQIFNRDSKTIYKLYILFKSYNRFSDGAILFRDRNTFDIRWCNIFNLLQDLKENGFSIYDTEIMDIDSVVQVGMNKEVILLNL